MRLGQVVATVRVMTVRIVAVVGIGVAGWVLLAAYGFGAFALAGLVAVLAGVAVAFHPEPGVAGRGG